MCVCVWWLRVSIAIYVVIDMVFVCFHSDERHPRPGKRTKTDDEEKSDEEDLNDANYDEVITGAFTERG